MDNNNGYTKQIISSCSEKTGIDISEFDMEELIKGMEVELEHGSKNQETDITDDDPEQTFKIMMVHMRESPTYYTDLVKHVEKEEPEGKETMEESKFAKRMKQLIGESEDKSKKQLMNEHWVVPAGLEKGKIKLLPHQKEIIKEVDKSKFDIM